MVNGVVVDGEVMWPVRLRFNVLLGTMVEEIKLSITEY